MPAIALGIRDITVNKIYKDLACTNVVLCVTLHYKKSKEALELLISQVLCFHFHPLHANFSIWLFPSKLQASLMWLQTPYPEMTIVLDKRELFLTASLKNIKIHFQKPSGGHPLSFIGQHCVTCWVQIFLSGPRAKFVYRSALSTRPYVPLCKKHVVHSLVGSLHEYLLSTEGHIQISAPAHRWVVT